MARYIIFAGVNGSGKTALYNILDGRVKLGQRVSIDDIAAELGDWRDDVVQIKAARTAMKLIDKCIAEGETFHQETTLPGEAIIRFVDRAKDAGFKIVLYFIGIESVDIAIERVKKRVESGGHGVAEAIVKKRFRDMNLCLTRLIPKCDEIYFYDNTLRFRQIALVRDGITEDVDSDLPKWFSELYGGTVGYEQICGETYEVPRE